MSLIQTYLATSNASYDADHQMLGGEFTSPGYHTRVPDGTYAHRTRETTTYAVALLASNDEDNITRAEVILQKIVSLQDQDPMSSTYGIWSWVMEEPLSDMDPPDWNWADFIGADLCHVLIEYKDKVSQAVFDAVRDALRHVVYSIFRRNVQPAYTNIALKGATVTTIAGEILNDSQLLYYGRRRWQRIIEHYVTEPVGSSEYNSPTYTMVAMRETERLLQLAQDDAARISAEKMRRWLWEMIAEHYHPATQQWAGPHGRAYRDYLDKGYVDFLSEQTGVAIAPHPEANMNAGWSPVQHLPCPDDLKPRFEALPDNDYSIRRLYIRRDDALFSQWATTWFSQDVTLGTANRDITWIQRRHLLGYWYTPDTPSVVLRYQFLKDGRDFSSGVVTHEQDGAQVLSLLQLAANLGDHHFLLNRPERSIYKAEDILVRYSLHGVGVRVRQDNDGRFIMQAGDWCAAIYPAISLFDGQAVTWESGADDGQVFVDAICYRGSVRAFDMIDIGTESYVAAGLELLKVDDLATKAAPNVVTTDASVQVSWDNLQIEMPRQALHINY